MNLFKGTIVILNMEVSDQDTRTLFTQDVYNWVKHNVAHDFNSYFVRKGVHVTRDMVWNGYVTGDIIDEKWFWIFEDTNEALLFKMTFQGTQPKAGM